MDESKHYIQLEGVSKRYGYNENTYLALQDICLHIDAGEFVVILGQSGSGKSTLLNIIGGMDCPTQGKAWVNGQELSELSDKKQTRFRAKEISFIFQYYNLIASLTIRENIALTKSLNSNSLDPDELLEAVGLTQHAKKFPTQLSGGEQQRASIARALSKNTPLILGDEPTGALDASTGVSILKLLQKLRKDYKKTIIIVTHNAAIAECATKVIKLKDGKIHEIKKNAFPKKADLIEW